MAFNPFHAFRKHQKAVFAGLTIICMLTFVLASGVSGLGRDARDGGGDFFSEIAHMFSGRGRTTGVAKLYAGRVEQAQITLLRAQRRTADSYMTSAIVQAHNNLFDKVFDALSYNKERKEIEHRSLFGARQQVFQYRGVGGQYQFFADYMRQQYLGRMEQYRFELQEAENKSSAAKNTSEAARAKKLMGDLVTAENQVNWLLQVPRDPLYPRDDLYFGGSTRVEGLIDFMIWRHQADQLGIHLTDEDIGTAVGNETMGYLKRENEEQILGSMGRDTINDPASVRRALGEEFRVRLAQATLVGYDPDGVGRVPAPISPYELWEYYLKNRTEVSVKMLPVQVSKFVSQVKQKPTTEDLQKLYERYKDEEYAPNKETPGFKEPRQVKVQWIDFSRDAPTFRNEARNLLLSQAAATVSNPSLAAAWTATFIKQYETATQSRFARTGADPEINKLIEPGFPLAMYIYRDLPRPETPASTVALAASGNLLGALFSVPARAYARESKEMAALVEEEARRRAPVAAAFVSAGTALSGALAMADTWAAAGVDPQYVPPVMMHRELVKGIEDKLSETIARNSETAFKEGLEKVRKEAGRQKGKFEAAAADYVKKQIALHKWPHGESRRLDNIYDIALDEGLKPLKDAYLITNINDPKAKKFGDQFFDDFATGKREDTKVYSPQKQSLNIGDKTFVFWTTEDNPPKVLPFDLVKKKVEDAWYLKEARPLAVKSAEDITQKAQKSGTPDREMVEAARGEPLIDIDGIARMVGKSARANQAPDYRKYVFPEEKIEYAGEDFLEKILDLKHVGDVTLLVDQPKKTYYVVAVTHRNEPSPIGEEYRNGYLLPQFNRERSVAYRRSILDRLRAEAHLEIFPEAGKLAEEKGTITED